MGRRKIEIKAIKDDRNRSVTFLKRKGGLFKKAYELSVLCSVDVAVIIFGHNKKLYEFSSGDINETIGRYHYYGAAHEHKGPEDFLGKKSLDDDDDEDMTSPPPESHSPPMPVMMPQLPNQAGYAHVAAHAPSASPPVTNRAPFHPPRGTPQPQQVSRPSSRNAPRRSSLNRVSQPPPPPPVPHASQTPPMTNGFAYVPNGPIYHPPPPPPPGMNGPSAPNPPAGPYPSYPAHPAPPPPPPPQPKEHAPAYGHEQRGQSIPPPFAHDRPQGPPAPPSPPQAPPRAGEGQTLQEPSRPSAKSQSIYTPVDENRSILMKHFTSGYATEPSRSEPGIKTEPSSRTQSLDLRGPPPRSHTTDGPTPPPPRSGKPSTHGPRHSSVSSLPDVSPRPRSDTGSFSVGGGPKRPRLTVQIPEEQSDHESTTAAESSPQNSNGTTSGGRPAGKGPHDSSHSSSVILPVPSPSAPASASALLSAGAQGPPNPFARPNPPVSSGPSNSNSIETPISALPSRFMNEHLLPSPSSILLEYNHYGRGGGDLQPLPGTPNFQTPIAATGPSFLVREEESGKRKSPDMDGLDGTAPKKLKT